MGLQRRVAEFNSIFRAARCMGTTYKHIVRSALSCEPHQGLVWTFKHEADAHRIRQTIVRKQARNAAKKSLQQQEEAARARDAVLVALGSARPPAWMTTPAHLRTCAPAHLRESSLRESPPPRRPCSEL